MIFLLALKKNHHEHGVGFILILSVVISLEEWNICTVNRKGADPAPAHRARATLLKFYKGLYLKLLTA